MDEAVPISNRIVCFEAEAHPVTKYSVSTSSHERESERERALKQKSEGEKENKYKLPYIKRTLTITLKYQIIQGISKRHI